MPFTLEGFALFLEAIFTCIYLYGWDKLPPRSHCMTGWPIEISGFFSAFFVVTANSWMNVPGGFTLVDGKLSDIDPWAAMFNSATGAQVTHMIVAAYRVTGFSVAAFYAWQLLRVSDGSVYELSQRYNLRAMSLRLLLALPLVPVQFLVGDWTAKVVAETQPVKLAAMEGQFETETRAPFQIGGIPNEATRETTPAINSRSVVVHSLRRFSGRRPKT